MRPEQKQPTSPMVAFDRALCALHSTLVTRSLLLSIPTLMKISTLLATTVGATLALAVNLAIQKVTRTERYSPLDQPSTSPSSVDSTVNHDACIAALSGAGIYVILDFICSIDAIKPTWSTHLQDESIKTIDAFSKYGNVLAYNVGNEVFISSATNAVPSSKPPLATQGLSVRLSPFSLSIPP
ncbi:hypothetical protein K438DRAFT_1960117 [Mycena galopus ATCC 62051]|nr:hypothetical protein K438DRAFT_1960117 [Mycena galopus ATCC 62051]